MKDIYGFALEKRGTGQLGTVLFILKVSISDTKVSRAARKSKVLELMGQHPHYHSELLRDSLTSRPKTKIEHDGS